MSINPSNCPVCDSRSFVQYKYGNHLNRLNRVLAKHLIALLIKASLRLVSRERYEKISARSLFSPFHAIRRCSDCGHGVYIRDIKPKQLTEYYASLYWNSKKSGELDITEELETTRPNGQYTLLKPYIKSDRKISILEIGAGDAAISRLIRKKHKTDIDLCVVEPGEAWTDYYRKCGISVAAKYFPFKENRKYGIIASSHWLEHVIDLNEAIRNMKTHLSSDGLLFVEVPNCTDEYWDLDFGDSPHIHFFTKDSLKKAFERHGFICSHIDEYGFTMREQMTRRKNSKSISPRIESEAIESIIHSKPRKLGSNLRAVFRCSTT